MRDHRLIDERSLALAHAIALRLRTEPELMTIARATLERWSKTCSPRAKTTLQEWGTILDGPVEDVIAVLDGVDERSIRLRQSNPFAGTLPQKVRNEILRRFEARDQATT